MLINNIYIKIFLNHPLYGLLSSYPILKNGPLDVSISTNIVLTENELNKHYQIFVNSYFNTKLIMTDNSNLQPLYRYIIVTQQNSFLPAIMSPLSSVVFTTTKIPIKSNYISNPVVYENSYEVPLSNPIYQRIFPIITDICTDEFSYIHHFYMSLKEKIDM